MAIILTGSADWQGRRMRRCRALSAGCYSAVCNIMTFICSLTTEQLHAAVYVLNTSSDTNARTFLGLPHTVGIHAHCHRHKECEAKNAIFFQTVKLPIVSFAHGTNTNSGENDKCRSREDT